jgi:hypothetical protein
MSNLPQPINPIEDILRASMEYTPAFQIRQPFQMVARRGPTSVVCLVRKVSLVGLRRLLRNELSFCRWLYD